MSQKHQPSYQPLATAAMDNPAMSNSSSGTGSNDDVATLGTLGIPATYSSQQLVGSSDTDSMEERAHLRGAGGVAPVGRPSRLVAIARSQWFTVTVLCFVNLINYMDRFTIAGVLTDIQKDFGIGDAKAGFLQTVFVISYMICAPIFGYLGDRYSRPLIMGVGVTLWSTTTLIGSFMGNYNTFITFRALVGIGEASYSTIAPTIISDLFVDDMRSKMLAVFYFAIPVGSGFGYIIGSKTAHLASNWRWALRVTPILGIAAVLLIMLIKDPERGESEGSHNIKPTSYKEDIVDLVKNRSFMLSTFGFTCVAFVTGALAWWGPTFIHLGLSMQPGNENLVLDDVAYKFGIVAMLAGLLGVPLGSILAQRLRPRYESCDPYICASGLLVSTPMVFASLVLARTNGVLCYIFVFLAQVSLNLCWSIVADILLYIVVPTRRSTAEAFQILISHALGDAGSPYLVGVLSDAFKKHLRQSHSNNLLVHGLESRSLVVGDVLNDVFPLNSTRIMVNDDPVEIRFEALQYSLFSTTFVEVLGGIFFLFTAFFILRDKHNAARAVQEASQQEDRRREIAA